MGPLQPFANSMVRYIDLFDVSVWVHKEVNEADRKKRKTASKKRLMTKIFIVFHSRSLASRFSPITGVTCFRTGESLKKRTKNSAAQIT